MKIAMFTVSGAEPSPRMLARIRLLRAAGHEVEVNPKPPEPAVVIAIDEWRPEE